MQFNTLFFMLILSCVCLSLAHMSFDDCCLKYVKTMGHKMQKHAVKYNMQYPDGDCNIPAIIFTMRRGRRYCADPREDWAKELIKKIEDRKDMHHSKRG